MTTPMHTVALASYAAVIAICAPRLLPTRGWASRAPRLALALWHAAAVSVLLAVGLAGGLWIVSPGPGATAVIRVLGDTIPDSAMVAVGGLAITGLMATRLAVVATRLKWAQAAECRRHLDLLGVLGRHDAGLGATVVPSSAPAAYCVAGTRRVVITEGALELLNRDELRAVLAHERAHLTGRHHLIVTWASVLARAVPGVPVFRCIRSATADLVELLADDKAVRTTQAGSLADAIVVLAGGAPTVGLSAGGGQAVARVERLLDPPRSLNAAARCLSGGTVFTLLVLPLFLALNATILTAGVAVWARLFG